MTTAERKRYAQQARRLASDIVEGRAPALSPDSWCGCALDIVVRRARGGRKHEDADIHEAWALAEFVDLPGRPNQWGRNADRDLVSLGLEEFGPDGAVFPLLALADELEAA